MMKYIRNKPAVFLGSFLILLGIAINRWSLGWLVAPSYKPVIELPIISLIIVIFQIINIGYGLLLLIKQPVIRLPGKAELILLGTGLGLSLLMLEVGARLWLNLLATPEQYYQYALYTDIPAGEFRWTPHHYLNYYPTPNFKRGLTYHNSLGYRNREFSVRKPAGVSRIVALGGSTTYTEKVEDNDKTFTAQLEKVLKDDYGYTVEVINAGVPGYNSWESLINLQFRVLDLDPDLVIVYHGTNDVHARNVEPSAYRGDNSGKRRQWRPPDISLWEWSTFLRILSFRVGFTYQVGLESLVDAPTAFPVNQNSIEILKKNPTIYYERNLQNMVAVAYENGVEIMFATWAHSPSFQDYAALPAFQQGFREHNVVTTQVAKDHQAPLFDFATVMPQGSQYWADGRHVNEEGALKKAELFAEFIHEQQLIAR